MKTIEDQKQTLSGKNITQMDVIKMTTDAFKFAIKNGFINNSSFTLSSDFDVNNLNSLTLKQRKKLANIMRRFISRPNIKSVNLFLHFLSTKFNLPKIKFKPSVKEQAWIGSRKEYVELRRKTEEARLKYKQAKTEFFKKETL